MFFSSFIFSSFFIIALLLDRPAQCSHCKDKCCAFVENFPARLKELRISFAKIKNYYEAKDSEEYALLDETILQDFKSPFGCHAMNEILRFYLDTVLPTAARKAPQVNATPIDVIANIFNNLKREVLTCKRYFSCQKPFSIESLMSTYKEMDVKGLYKAMGELDLLFNYIEDYMVSKRTRH